MLFTPMPRPSTQIAVSAKPRCLRSSRTAKRRSSRITGRLLHPPITRLPDSAIPPILLERELFHPSGAVADLLGLETHALEERQIEIRHRRVPGIRDVA